MNPDQAFLRSARFLADEAFVRLVRPGDSVVDATLGTGQDCLKLCRLVGEGGKVHGFDVQEAALTRTSGLLRQHGLEGRAVLHHTGHERMGEFVPPGIRLAAFNLGWLPGSDKLVTTRVETTLQALQAALGLLSDFGMAVLCVYPGHAEGKMEEEALAAFARGLPPSGFTALWQKFINGGAGAPSCLLIEKLPKKPSP